MSVIEDYIRNAARIRGIDPDTAVRVANSEGGVFSWNKQSTYYKNGVQETSYGPFQLYTGGGLGNVFAQQTGLDPSVAANGPAGVDFALDQAKKSGWGAWYGAAKAGIGKWDGITDPGTASNVVDNATSNLPGFSGDTAYTNSTAGTASNILGDLSKASTSMGDGAIVPKEAGWFDWLFPQGVPGLAGSAPEGATTVQPGAGPMSTTDIGLGPAVDKIVAQLSEWLPRGGILVLGFIIIAVGLLLFKEPAKIVVSNIAQGK